MAANHHECYLIYNSNYKVKTGAINKAYLKNNKEGREKITADAADGRRLRRSWNFYK
jgi:hypothetical protein